MAEIVVMAKGRTDRGKNAARRLRREGFIPGVVYGGKDDNIAVAVDPKALKKVLRSEAGRNAILKLDIAGSGSTNAILKSWQVDPIKENFLHADFYRIAMDVAIRVTVPIHVLGEARGVKVDGGILELIMRNVEVECLPGDIPEHIDIDVSDLAINGALRVSDNNGVLSRDVIVDYGRQPMTDSGLPLMAQSGPQASSRKCLLVTHSGHAALWSGFPMLAEGPIEACR